MQVAIRMERLFTIWQPLSPSPSGSPHAINPRGFGGQRPPFKSDVFRFMPFNGYQTKLTYCILNISVPKIAALGGHFVLLGPRKVLNWELAIPEVEKISLVLKTFATATLPFLGLKNSK